MKIFLSLLMLSLFTVVGLAQTYQPNDKTAQIKEFITRTHNTAEGVLIKIKPGGHLGSFSSDKNLLPNGKTIIGEITYISEVGFSIKRVASYQADFVYYDFVTEARKATANENNWNKFTQNTAKGIRKVGEFGTNTGTFFLLLLKGQIFYCC